MIGLNNKYIIRFIIFEENKDILIINRLIKDGNLNNYEIIQRNNPLEIIDEITKNERHLCLRYHAHIICYLYTSLVLGRTKFVLSLFLRANDFSPMGR